MRIKKKEILEALDKDKISKDLNTAEKFIDNELPEFKKKVSTALGDTDNAKKVADNLATIIVDPKEQKLEEDTDEVKPKKRVKEIVKVKNLKK
jgi:hypothetical protein